MFTDYEIINLFKDMIRLNTTNLPGNEFLMIDFIASILDEHGIQYEIIEKEKGRSNIIAYVGPKTNLPPLAFISHVDVVGVENQEWTHPPFEAIESDRFIYGRGTLDTKHLTLMSLISLIKASKEKLNRRVYFIATADEEKGSNYGMPLIAEKYQEELTHAMVLNEGGGFYIENKGKPYYLCTTGEKGRCEVKVKLTGQPGASSMPPKHTLISEFKRLMKLLIETEFPLIENNVYNTFIDRLNDDIEHPLLKQFKSYNGHNKIILSKYDIGKKGNILLQNGEVDFALQILPSFEKDDVVTLLDQIFKDKNFEYEITAFAKGFESSVTCEGYAKIEELTSKYFEGAKVLPVYALGRTDGRFLGNFPSDIYGFTPVTKAIPFERVLKLVHQADEKIDCDSILLGTNLLTDFTLELAGENDE